MWLFSTPNRFVFSGCKFLLDALCKVAQGTLCDLLPIGPTSPSNYHLDFFCVEKSLKVLSVLAISGLCSVFLDPFQVGSRDSHVACVTRMWLIHPQSSSSLTCQLHNNAFLVDILSLLNFGTLVSRFFSSYAEAHLPHDHWWISTHLLALQRQEHLRVQFFRLCLYLRSLPSQGIMLSRAFSSVYQSFSVKGQIFYLACNFLDFQVLQTVWSLLKLFSSADALWKRPQIICK